jgi:hypothetical protein
VTGATDPPVAPGASGGKINRPITALGAAQHRDSAVIGRLIMQGAGSGGIVVDPAGRSGR